MDRKKTWSNNVNQTFLVIFKHCEMWMNFGKWPMKYEFFFMVEKLVVNVLIYKDGFRLQIVRNLDFCKAKENGINERKNFSIKTTNQNSITNTLVKNGWVVKNHSWNWQVAENHRTMVLNKKLLIDCSRTTFPSFSHIFL